MGDEDIDLELNQFFGQTTQPLVIALRPAIFDEEVRAFEPTAIAQPCAQCCQPGRVTRRGDKTQKADACNLRLLRPHRERPRCRRAAEQRDEIAALHSITSSAIASSLSGTAKASALAVFKLITSSNLTDCITGRSVGFVPLRILAA